MTKPPERIVGMVLAGGKSRRMGADKALVPLRGRPLLAHVVERLAPQVSELILNANNAAAELAGFGLPVIADSIAGHAGPLAGIHAGLAWTSANRPGVAYVATVATDTPFFPADLVARLLAAASGSSIAVARSVEGVHPVMGLWPVTMIAALEQALRKGRAGVRAFAADHGAVQVPFGPVEIGDATIDPFFNINRPEDLALAESLLATKL